MKNETDALNDRIIELENKRTLQWGMLKEEFHVAYENLKPINIAKNAFREMTSFPVMKSNMVSNVIGLGTGFLSKKLLIGNSHNPLKRLVGTLLQFAVANVVSKHSDGIKSKGANLLQGFIKRRKLSKKEVDKNGSDLFI